MEVFFIETFLEERMSLIIENYGIEEWKKLKIIVYLWQLGTSSFFHNNQRNQEHFQSKFVQKDKTVVWVPDKKTVRTYGVMRIWTPTNVKFYPALSDY